MHKNMGVLFIVNTFCGFLTRNSDMISHQHTTVDNVSIPKLPSGILCGKNSKVPYKCTCLAGPEPSRQSSELGPVAMHSLPIRGLRHKKIQQGAGD